MPMIEEDDEDVEEPE